MIQSGLNVWHLSVGEAFWLFVLKWNKGKSILKRQQYTLLHPFTPFCAGYLLLKKATHFRSLRHLVFVFAFMSVNKLLSLSPPLLRHCAWLCSVPFIFAKNNRIGCIDESVGVSLIKVFLAGWSKCLGKVSYLDIVSGFKYFLSESQFGLKYPF